MMTDLTNVADASPLTPRLEAVSDYERVRRAIEFITERWRDQPSHEMIAAHVGLDPARLAKLFRRWCGLSPKAFIQAITLDHARALLREEASVLDATYEVGLSGPARLHDLFVVHEAMTPGEFRERGAGLEIVWGFHPSPFGEALVMATARGLAGLAFADGPGDHMAVFEDLAGRWPRASYREDRGATARFVDRIFDPATWSAEQPLRVVMIGSDFQLRVWETLLRVPVGKATTYGTIAQHLGRPAASRAVGAAVGRNPLSFVVPCHRVLGRSGALTGYHWGLTRKRAILGWESALLPASQ